MKELFSGTAFELFKSMIDDIVKSGSTPASVKTIVRFWVGNSCEVKALLNIMYDPLIKFNYKLHHDDFYVDYSNLRGEDFSAVGEALELLYDKQVTGKHDKEELVWSVLEKNPVMALFLRKNLDLGFGVSSAKDLGIISQHSPQKGVLLTDTSKVKYPCVADFKYNGNRLSVSVDIEGTVSCLLLKGNKIAIPLLEDIFKNYSGYTFDGELVYTAGVPEKLKPYCIGGLSEKDRIEVAGRVTSATAMKASLPMKDLHFVIYDVLLTDDFVVAKPSEGSYITRRNFLVSLYARDLERLQGYTSLSSAWNIQNERELESLIAWNKSIGGEGFMVKELGSTYDYKKNNQWWKVKHFKEADFKIIGYTPHSRNPNWIGSLDCFAIIDNKQIRVSVGSGLNDADRHISLYSKYEGQIVMVTYMDVVKNKKGFSVTNPRFAKDTASRRLVEILRVDGNHFNK